MWCRSAFHVALLRGTEEMVVPSASYLFLKSVTNVSFFFWGYFVFTCFSSEFQTFLTFWCQLCIHIVLDQDAFLSRRRDFQHVFNFRGSERSNKVFHAITLHQLRQLLLLLQNGLVVHQRRLLAAVRVRNQSVVPFNISQRLPPRCFLFWFTGWRAEQSFQIRNLPRARRFRPTLRLPSRLGPWTAHPAEF